jgi:protein SCO1
MSTAGWLLGFGTLAVSGALAGLTVGSTVPTAPVGPPTAVERIRAAHLPNVPLITQAGRAVRFYDDLVKGQVVAINFMYTSCRNSCPVTALHLNIAQQDLAQRHGDKVRFLSITLRPEFDTPDVLRAYASAQANAPGWTYLTGNLDDIERLRRVLGVYDRDPLVDQDPSQHAGVLVVGNEPIGRWKSVATLVNPVRIRQAVERVMLPVQQWPTGSAMIDEVPYDDSPSRR